MAATEWGTWHLAGWAVMAGGRTGLRILYRTECPALHSVIRWWLLLLIRRTYSAGF